MRLALRWLLDNDPPKALQLAGALTRFWYLRDHAREGHRWLSEALEKSSEARTPFRARALVGAAFLADRHGQEADAQCREALEIYRSARDVWGTAHALRHLGYFASERQQIVPARRYYEQALALFEQLRDERGMAVTLLCLGFLALQRDDLTLETAQSRAWTACAQTLFRHIGNAWGVSLSTSHLGTLAHNIDRSEEAVVLYRAALQSDHRATDSAKREEMLSMIECLQGNVQKGRLHLSEALLIARDQGDRMEVARLLNDYAIGFREWKEGSVRLLAASAALDRSLDARQSGRHAALRDLAERDLRAHLAPERFDAAYRQGESLSWTEAVDEVLMSVPHG